MEQYCPKEAYTIYYSGINMLNNDTEEVLMDFYKVNRVIPRKSKLNEEVTVYSILLNNEIWVNNILPDLARWNRARKRYEEEHPELASFSKKHGGLESLTGKYLCCHLEKTKYGHNISGFYSLDVQQYVGDILEKFTGELYKVTGVFSLYDFLVIKGYPKNKDGSISSKKTPNIRIIQSGYQDYIYREGDIAIEPYLPNQRTDILTNSNIEHIFIEFYQNKVVTEEIEGADNYGSWEHSYRYKKNLGIYIDSQKWKQSMKMHVQDKMMEEITTYLVRLGDKLRDEHNKYLTTVQRQLSALSP